MDFGQSVNSVRYPLPNDRRAVKVKMNLVVLCELGPKANDPLTEDPMTDER